MGAGEGTGFAVGAAEDAGAGEALEDRDCWGERAVPGRGRAHAPLFPLLVLCCRRFMR